MFQSPVNSFELCSNISRTCGLLSTAPTGCRISCWHGCSIVSSADYSRPSAAPFLTAISAPQQHRPSNRESAQSWLNSSREWTLMAAGHLQATVRRDKTLVPDNWSPLPVDRISRAPLRTRVSLSLAPPKFHSATTRLLQF